MSGDSFWTWYQHAAVAVFGPPLATVGPGDPLRDLGMMATAILLAFWVRERKDRRKKIRLGIWNAKWKRDRAGDLLGPVCACACYLIAWGLS